MTRHIRLGIHTLSHFAVDFGCFYVLFACFSDAGLGTASLAAGFLLYNVIAFGLQAFIGALCDAHHATPAARIGCALVLLAVLTGALLPGKTAAYATMLTCALGNAFYHVGGGIDTLVAADDRMADSGVFVSSGSMGVLFGTLAGNARVGWIVPAALMAACLLMQAFVAPLHGDAAFGAADGKRPFAAALALLAAAILLRAYVGFSVPMPWKAGGVSIYVPAFAAFLGKAAGGFAADRFGARMVGCAALAASAVLFGAFYGSMPLCALGIFLFNIPMPITLCACCDLLPENPGLAFGLTTLALLIGVVPTFFFALPAPVAPWTVAALTLFAFACLLLSTAGKARARR